MSPPVFILVDLRGKGEEGVGAVVGRDCVFVM